MSDVQMKREYKERQNTREETRTLRARMIIDGFLKGETVDQISARLKNMNISLFNSHDVRSAVRYYAHYLESEGWDSGVDRIAIPVNRKTGEEVVIVKISNQWRIQDA